MHGAFSRNVTAALLTLAGAISAVFITGKLDVAAMLAVSLGAGLGLLVGKPSVWPGWLPVALAGLLAVAVGASLVPAGADALPAWRAGAPDVVALAGCFAAMPAHALFWWLVLIGTIAAGLFLVASPLDVGSLRIFLHVVAGVVGVYAVVSIVQAHTAWSYAFSGGANFGLLPNRNHTATLLVVGSIVSFGLMQWEASHSHRVGAVLSVIWGAPSLAALLFFSTSRAGVIFLAAGLVLWAAGAAGKAVSRRTTLGAAAILVGFLAVLFVLGGSTVRDRLGALWNEVMAMEVGEEGVREVDFRQPVFRDTVTMIADAPLTGQGLGHFEFVFPHYREASLRSVRVLHPESDWLMVAAESGIPALLILLTLVGWYLMRNWRARKESGGLLRWTVASAIGAALLHGTIDVPWHRPALGWFLLVVALVALPSSDRVLRWTAWWRGLQVLTGLVLISAGAYFVWAETAGRPPLAYRWAAYDRELKALSAAQRYEDGEILAGEAVRDFPLHYHAYYWRAAFLRTFEGTDNEIKDDIAAGLFVEPVLPVVASEQAQVWADINADWEAESRVEAIRRASLIEQRSGPKGAAVAELEKAMRAAQDRPAVQSALRKQMGANAFLLAQWARLANTDLADEFLGALGVGASAWLDVLPPDLKGQVLDRWITLPSAAGAVAYMESRNTREPGAYWRQLANYYAKVGDKARAVGIVAQAEGVPLDGSLPEGEFTGQLAALQEQGNEVAVRRLLKEAAESEKADPDKLRVAMASYAASGDWEMAWRAASRLVTATKNRQ
jgi:O-antigen ligase